MVNILLIKKNGAFLLSGIVLMISALIYLRASTDEIDDPGLDALFWLSFLSIFAGLNEALEVYDHLKMKPAETDHPSDSDDQQKAITSTGRFGQVAFASLASPMLLACSYAHMLQGVALSKTMYGGDGLYSQTLSAALMLPALVKFSVISLPHAYHACMGSRESFSLSVTNNAVSRSTKISLPPMRWWIMLGVMTALHIPEGRLIAAPISHRLVKRLATYGFALAESIPHINQLEQIPHNIAQLKNIAKKQATVYFVAGCLSGLVHSSQTILAVFANQENSWERLSPVFEFMVGFLEAQQHLVPAINRLGLFGTSANHAENPDSNRPVTSSPLSTLNTSQLIP